MKYSTINLGQNSIEIHNSLLGKETIKVNGNIVSSEYSMFGADHFFTIREDGRTVECKITIGYSWSGVVYDFYKDNRPIIISSKTNFLYVFLGIFTVFLTLKLIGNFL